MESINEDKFKNYSEYIRNDLDDYLGGVPTGPCGQGRAHTLTTHGKSCCAPTTGLWYPYTDNMDCCVHNTSVGTRTDNCTDRYNVNAQCPPLIFAMSIKDLGNGNNNGGGDAWGGPGYSMLKPLLVPFSPNITKTLKPNDWPINSWDYFIESSLDTLISDCGCS